MSPRSAAKKTRSDYAREAHERQLEAGWRRLGVRLPPDANSDLESLCVRWGVTPTTVISTLLHEAMWREIARENEKP